MKLKLDFAVKRLPEIFAFEWDTEFVGRDALCLRTYQSLGYVDDISEFINNYQSPDRKYHIATYDGGKACALIELRRKRREYAESLRRTLSEYGYRSVSDIWRDEMNVESLIRSEFSREVERWNKEHGKEEKIRLI